MKKKNIKIIIYIIIALSSIGLITSASIILYNNYIHDNKDIETEKIDSIITEEKSNEELINDLINEFDNDEIVSILNIPNLITIPIPQGEDNKFYLKNGVGKKPVYGGSPFIDYRTPIGSKQINIYGHNSVRYNLSFTNLENYLDNEYTKNNDIIELKTVEKTYKYIITYVYIDDKLSTDEHYKFEYDNFDDWQVHLDKMGEKSFYNTDIGITADENILVLQTCLFGEHKRKFLIIVARQFN